MADLLLEKTRQSELQPLMANGVPAYRIFGQLAAELRGALSADHLLLFAEPNVDAATGDIEWYAATGGDKARLRELPSRQQAAAELELARLVKGISDHVGRLSASGDATAALMAQSLATALEIPGDEHIFVVGGRPVLSGWGHVPRGPAAPQQRLLALSERVLARAAAAGPAAPPAPAAPSPSPSPSPPPLAPSAVEPAVALGAAAEVERAPDENGRYRLVIQRNTVVSVPAVASWANPLLWLLFVALLLVIAHLLLKYCALGWPGTAGDLRWAFINYCEAPGSIVGGAPPASGSAQPALLARLRDLERQLDEKRRACTAGLEPRRATPVVPPAVDSDRALRDSHAKIGAVNVVLTWATDDDLDLHVTCPDHVTRIFFSNAQACGGVLDVDQNRDPNRISPRPVENVYFAESIPGDYLVEVHRWIGRSSGSNPTPFKVELRINNEIVEAHCGGAAGDEHSPRMQVFRFTLPYLPHQQPTTCAETQ